MSDTAIEWAQRRLAQRTTRRSFLGKLGGGVVALAMALYSSFAEAATFAAIARLVVFAVTCAALVMLRRTQGPSPGFQLPAGTMFAIAGTAFSTWLLATRSSNQVVIMFGIIVTGIVLRGVTRRD